MRPHTHTGYILGDARVSERTVLVYLRETKQHWVDVKTGTKYKKNSGWPVTDNKWPIWSLQRETIKEVQP